jgi:hypothetical protein
MSLDLDADDLELVALAHSLLNRTSTGQTAAGRDSSGKTHLGVAVETPHLKLEALQSLVASLVSSGAVTIESVAVIGWSPTPDGVAAVRDINPDCRVWLVDSSGRATGRA